MPFDPARIRPLPEPAIEPVGLLRHERQHLELALGRVVTALRTSQDFGGLLAPFVTQVQLVEDALQAILAAVRDPAVATGVTLDRLASIVGVPRRRASLSDAAFRTWVSAQVTLNSGWSSLEQLGAGVRTLSGWPAVRLLDAGDGGSPFGTTPGPCLPTFEPRLVTYSSLTEEQARDVARFLKSGTAAGVRAQLIVLVSPSVITHEDAFGFDGRLTGSGASILDDPAFPTLAAFDTAQTL